MTGKNFLDVALFTTSMAAVLACRGIAWKYTREKDPRRWIRRWGPFFGGVGVVGVAWIVIIIAGIRYGTRAQAERETAPLKTWTAGTTPNGARVDVVEFEQTCLYVV